MRNTTSYGKKKIKGRARSATTKADGQAKIRSVSNSNDLAAKIRRKNGLQQV